jgi:ferredoxin
MSDHEDLSRSGFEPELGGLFRELPNRSGYEPELGGDHRQKGVYVDEVTCVGCKHCIHVAPNTFTLESDYGRSRVFNQNGDCLESVQEAIDTCPVDCIHFVDYSEISALEKARKKQVIRQLGLPQTNPNIKLDSHIS